MGKHTQYGFAKLKSTDTIIIPCSWNLNLINRMVDLATNSICSKSVTDMVTGVKIEPDPFVFDTSDSVNVKMPRKLTYESILFRSREEVTKYLQALRNDPARLQEYIDFIAARKKEAEERKTR